MPLSLAQARQHVLNRKNNIVNQPVKQNTIAEENEKPENTGGILGGIGYTLGKIGLGALRGLEGIWDYAAGGIADLFGADEWAYKQATESPFDDLTTELDAWYNPSEFMQFVGDVGAGVGQMLVVWYRKRRGRGRYRKGVGRYRRHAAGYCTWKTSSQKHCWESCIYLCG